MTDEQIKELVKKIEPFFIGFKADGKSLKNSNGMEICFREDWKNKTIVSGLYAKKRHSIGCSFEKPIEKIYKDIRRRLMPEYHEDFFKNKKENIERTEAKELEKQKLLALASVVGGELSYNYGQRYSGNSEYVDANNASIYQTYQGLYEFQITLTYFDAMRLAKIIKESTFLEPKQIEEET